MELVLHLGMSPKRHGVGPALRYESQKTRGMTCPWVMSQNSHYYIDQVSCGALISDVYIVGESAVISCERMDGLIIKNFEEN